MSEVEQNLKLASKCLRKLEQVIVQLHKNGNLDLDSVELLLDLAEDASEYILMAAKLVK